MGIKKLLKIGLLSVMAMGIFSSNVLAEESVIPEVQTFPAEGLAMEAVDWMDIDKVYYSGLYERSVTLGDDTERTYKVYIPTTAKYNDYVYYIAVPDGVDTAEFLKKSGWIDLAEKEENSMILFVFEPENQTWKEAENEMDYISTAFADMNDNNGLRRYIYPDEWNWRWTGYGAGGEVVQNYALENPMNIASLVVVDGSANIEQSDLDSAGSICFTNAATGYVFEEWSNREMPVPIWLIGPENEAVINYWKNANDCTDVRTELAEGYRYDQKPFSSNLMTYDQKVGQVRVSETVPDYTDLEFTQEIYDFLRYFSRTGTKSPYSNMLTAAMDDSRLIRETIIVDDTEREWYVSLPDGYTGEEELPLVIYFHGFGQSGILGMRQGDWWKYGNTKNFISVCPTGSLTEPTDGSIPFHSWKIGSMGGEESDKLNLDYEEKFVRAMVDKLTEEYKIDESRMYITGQSNGGGMTKAMSERCGDLFAASASTGNPSVALSDIPTFVLYGEFDLTPVCLTQEGMIGEEKIVSGIQEALQSKGIAYEEMGTTLNGIFRNYIWTDSDGIPAVRYCVAEKCAHSWRQNIAEMFWNEWFCNFSKDLETGKTVYRNMF